MSRLIALAANQHDRRGRSPAAVNDFFWLLFCGIRLVRSFSWLICVRTLSRLFPRLPKNAGKSKMQTFGTSGAEPRYDRHESRIAIVAHGSAWSE
jgi:hypothetical protein